MNDEKLIYDTWDTTQNLAPNQEVCIGLYLNSSIDMNDGFTGKVVDENGDPVEGATVKLFNANNYPIIHTVTNENGDYFLEYNKTDDVLIYAVKDKYIMSEELITNWSAGIVRMQDIVLNKAENTTAMCFGKVYNELDEIFPDMYIYLLQDGVEKYTAVSNSLGEINIFNIEPGIYEVYGVCKTHTLEPMENIEFVAGEEKHITFNAVPLFTGDIKGTISGVVYTGDITKDEETNIASGVLVALYKVEESGNVFVTKTFSDINGRFFFGNVEEGNYIIKTTIILPYN